MQIRSFISRYLVLGLALISLSAIALASGVSRKTFSTAPDPVFVPTSTVAGQSAVFAGGCFWGMEGVFEHLKGVSEVVSGYSGGSAETANYAKVSSKQTEHAESVKITYNPSQISYEQLLKVYFSVAHDPTQLNRQGPDQGRQYRSAVFFANNEQRQITQAYIDQLKAAHRSNKAIATQVVPLKSFYAAEEYHQDFIDRNQYHPYVMVHDLPKIARLQDQFPDIYQE